MKKLVFAFLFVGSFAFADQDVPDGCPVDDAALNQAVNEGKQIVCTIDYFTGGHGGQWVTRPTRPNPQPTVPLACMDSYNVACSGIAMCESSPYYKCSVYQGR